MEGTSTMNVHDLTITIQTLLSIFGAISIVVAGTASITKMFSPFKELKAKVDEHDDIINGMTESVQKQSNMQREVCKSLIVIMNHEITGNSIDKLKERQEDLQKFLIDN